MINKVYAQDSIFLMKKMKNEFVDLVITSPPYSDMRAYEGTLDFQFKPMATELYRIIKSGGVLVWVIGDKTENGSESGESFREALHFMELGFNLHDTMIYQKHNFANPSSNRYHQIFEYMFVFAKGKPKTFNPIKDIPTVCYGKTNWGKNTIRRGDELVELPKKEYKTPFGMRRNIWKYSTGGTTDADNKLACGHPAKFPLKLAMDHVTSWSNVGDLVFDPMAGSCTVAVAAKKLKRNFICCDKVKKYTDIGKERLKLIQ